MSLSAKYEILSPTESKPRSGYQLYWHLGRTILCCGGCPVHCRMFSRILGLYWRDTSSTPSAVKTKASPDITKASFEAKGFWVAHMVKKICLQCRRPGFHPRVGKITWRREWQPTPVFRTGESHGQRRLAGYRPWGSQRLRQGWGTNTFASFGAKPSPLPPKEPLLWISQEVSFIIKVTWEKNLLLYIIS